MHNKHISLEILKELFKKAVKRINEKGWDYYSRKMFQVAMGCLIVIVLSLGGSVGEYPYTPPQPMHVVSSQDENQIRTKQVIYPTSDDLETIIAKSQLIKWNDAKEAIQQDEQFSLIDIEGEGTHMFMIRKDGESFYNAQPLALYDKNKVKEIMTKDGGSKKRSAIVINNNSYYMASYCIGDNCSDIKIHFIDSTIEDIGIVDGLHQHEINKILVKQEEILKQRNMGPL